jgi:hypothetical protein
MQIDLIHAVQLATPTIVRSLLPIGKEVVAHLIHAGTHKTLHIAAHKGGILHRVFHKLPWTIDVVIIGVMLVFGSLTEGGEHEASHVTFEHAEVATSGE